MFPQTDFTRAWERPVHVTTLWWTSNYDLGLALTPIKRGKFGEINLLSGQGALGPNTNFYIGFSNQGLRLERMTNRNDEVRAGTRQSSLGL